MARFRALLRAISHWSSLKHFVSSARRSGVGFGLVVVLSLGFAVATQAQTDSGSGDGPTLTIVSERATVAKGEEVMLTIAASSAPSSDIVVNFRVETRGASVNETATAAIPLAAGKGETWLTLDTGSAQAAGVTVTITLLEGAGYTVGSPAAASVSVSEEAATPTPTPTPGGVEGKQVLGVAPAPTGVSASGNSTSSVRVSWSFHAGTEFYWLERILVYGAIDIWGNIDKDFSGTSKDATGLASCTNYDFRVRGRGDGGLYETTWSSATETSGSTLCPTPTPTPVPTTPPEPTTPPPEPTTPPRPPAPDGFSGRCTSETSISASWNAVSGTSGYRFGIWINGWQDGSVQTGTSASKSGLKKNTNYNIRVRAVGDGVTYAGESLNQWGEVSTRPCETPTPLPTPPKPTGIVTSATTSSIKTTWSLRTGVSSYDLDIDNGGWKSVSISGNSGEAGGLKSDTTYNLRLRGRGDGATYQAAWGDYAEFSQKTASPTPTPTPTPTATSTPLPKPPAPRNVRASFIPDPVGYGLDIIWDSISNVASYRVERGYENASGTPVWPGGMDHVTDVTTAQHTETGLTCERDHIFRVSAKGDGNRYRAVYGPATLLERYVPIAERSSATGSSAATSDPCAKPNVTYIPLPRRKGRLSWNNIDKNEGYEVQVKKVNTSAWSAPTPVAKDSHYLQVDLDKIIKTGTSPDTFEGLAHHEAGYSFRVRTLFASPTNPSDYSDSVTIVDNLILSVNGDSRGESGGKMLVKWQYDVDYLNTAYAIRYRKLPGNHDGDQTWAPVGAPNVSSWTHASAVTPTPISTKSLEHPVSGLELYEIYGVQVYYVKGSERVFSAREAYVWPSDIPPRPRERVGTYPYFGHHENRTYNYIICEDTFYPSDKTKLPNGKTKQENWVALIENAMGRWQSATNGFIAMTRNTTDSCTQYPPIPTPVDLFVALAKAQEQVKVSEISMIDLSGIPANQWLTSVYQVAADIYKGCLEGAVACVTSPAYSPFPLHGKTQLTSVDITFSKHEIEKLNDAKEFPKTPSGVVFNACVDSSSGPMPNDNWNETYFLYALAVHEIGHALGLSGWGIDLRPSAMYLNAHATTLETVMNYDSKSLAGLIGGDEPDCAPHPLDIMAIFALYQTVSRTTPSP